MEQTIQSAGLNRLINLIDYYFSLGGMQVQFNVVSRETLLRAQKGSCKISESYCTCRWIFCLFCKSRKTGTARYYR